MKYFNSLFNERVSKKNKTIFQNELFILILSEILIINCVDIFLLMFAALQARFPRMPYIYAITSNITFIFMQMCMKNVSKSISPAYALVVRGVGLFLLNTFVIIKNGYEIHTNDPYVYKLYIQRMILSSVSLCCLLIPITYIPSGIATSLFYTCPIMIFFVEAYFQNKKIHIIHFVFTIISFFGVLLIVRPDLLLSSDIQKVQIGIFYILPLFGALTHSFSMMILHKLKGKTSSVVVLHYFYIGQVILNSILANIFTFQINYEGLNFKFYVSLIGLVVLAYTTQNLMTKAILLKPASKILAFGYLAVVGTSVMDIIVFNQVYGFLNMMGILMASIGLASKLFIKQQTDSIHK